MLKRLCLALGLSVLSAPSFAAEPLPMPLAEELPVEVELTQHEMTVDVPDYSSGLGVSFGVIGALIGSSIENSQAKKGEVALSPIRTLLVNYDFEQRLVAALQTGLADSGVATHPLVSVNHVPWQARTDLQKMPARALVIRPRYALDQSMSAMYLKLLVTLEDRQVRNGKVKSRIAFMRPYTFQANLAHPVPNQTTAWTALGAERLAQLMDQSVDQSVAILRHDFSAAGRQQWAQKAKGRSDVAGRTVPGRVERREGDVAWVRLGKKHTQSLTAYQLVRPGAVAPAQPVPEPPRVAESAVAAVTAAPVEATEVVSVDPTETRSAPMLVAQVQTAPTQAAAVPSAEPSVQARAVPAPVSATPRNAFWEQYRPKDGANAPATTP